MDEFTFTSETLKTHNGRITIENPSSGQHRTFQIKTQRQDARFAPGERIVSLLTGPNREDYTNWQGFGFVLDNGSIAVWKSKRGGIFDTYARMLTNPAVFEAKGARYLFEGRCRRCNRSLTNPVSIDSGIGEECARISGAQYGQVYAQVAA